MGRQYDVIYADPPWAWGKAPLVNRGSARTVEKEYPTMQPDEIKALPVRDFAKPICALFLWATSPKLPLAFEVMKAWGFEYKSTAFVWIKINRKQPTYFTGMGFYTRQNAEFVLLGTRGPKSPERLNKGIHQVVDEADPVVAPVSEHSRKPDEVRQRIDALFGGDKLELFARSRSPGWDTWGNELNNDVEMSNPADRSSSIKAELSPYLRGDLLYGLQKNNPGRSFHILREGTFPALFECGLSQVGELIDWYPLNECCANCIRVVEAA